MDRSPIRKEKPVVMTHLAARLRRVTSGAVLAVAAVLGLAIFLPAVAQAQIIPYAPAGAPTLSTTSPAPGAPLSLSGDGFQAGSEVRAVMFSEPVVLGTAQASAAGEVDLDVKIPASFAAGSEHRIEIQGVDPSGEVRILSQDVTLAGGTGNTLAKTGAVILPVVGVGAVLLIAGGALVTSGRGRRTTN